MSEGITTSPIENVEGELGTAGQSSNLRHIITRVYKIFIDHDATHLEINPLGRSEDGFFTGLSARFTFDDEAKGGKGSCFPFVTRR